MARPSWLFYNFPVQSSTPASPCRKTPRADRTNWLCSGARDNVHPGVYTDIALGRLDHLPPEALPIYDRPLPEADFHKHIKGRRNLLIGLLKVADLELSPLPPLEKMLELLRWAHRDFLMLVTVTLFAGAFFSSRRTRPLLKDLRSRDRGKALAAVHNALWDLQGILAWTRQLSKHHTSNRYWLLCSRDRALKDLAVACVCDADEPHADRHGFKAYMERYWSPREAAEIFAVAMSLQDDQDNPNRRLHQPREEEYIEGLRVELETRLLNWRP